MLRAGPGRDGVAHGAHQDVSFLRRDDPEGDRDLALRWLPVQQGPQARVPITPSRGLASARIGEGRIWGSEGEQGRPVRRSGRPLKGVDFQWVLRARWDSAEAQSGQRDPPVLKILFR